VEGVRPENRPKKTCSEVIEKDNLTRKMLWTTGNGES